MKGSATNETDTLFLWDPWIDGMILKSTFSRLFYLIDNKMITVAEILSWIGEGGEA